MKTLSFEARRQSDLLRKIYDWEMENYNMFIISITFGVYSDVSDTCSAILVCRPI